MPIATVELALPPSVNNAYYNVAGVGRKPSKSHREWKRSAGWEAKFANLPKFASPYAISIAVPATTRGDVDGRIKLAVDLFVELGITPDDHHCERVTCFRQTGIAAGRCVIEITGDLA